jgi:hypothetical protein
MKDTDIITSLHEPRDGRIEIRYTEGDVRRADDFAHRYLDMHPVHFEEAYEPSEDAVRLAIIAFLKTVDHLPFVPGMQAQWLYEHEAWDGDSAIREFALEQLELEPPGGNLAQGLDSSSPAEVVDALFASYDWANLEELADLLKARMAIPATQAA